MNVGIAQAATTAATEHAASRRYPDGTALAELPTIQHQLADMDMPCALGARLLSRDAARLGEAGDAAALVALMEAKVVGLRHGSARDPAGARGLRRPGYTPALPIERHLRDARAGR